jgi:cob(I)alamin adenosyltransferase
MPRITKVYTRTGDDGSTALGIKTRVAKDSARVEAYGTVDELNSVLGVVLAGGVTAGLEEQLRRVQNDLFHLGSDLCVPEAEKATLAVPRIEERHVVMLEQWMDAWSEELEPLANFVLPGGAPAAAALQLARAVCRRAERRVVTLARQEKVGPFAVQYLNRLSDALFVAARYENARRGVAEPLWDSRR